MAIELPLLDQVTIASPCSAPWENMRGNDQVRFCKQCAKHVYNFSEMTREDAEALIIAKEGKLCGRFFRRQDGTTLTRDCPVGVMQVRARAVRALCGMAATFLALVTGGLWGRSAAGTSQMGVDVVDEGPLSRFASWVSPRPRFEAIGGVVCLPKGYDFGSRENLNPDSAPQENNSPNSTAEP